MAKPNLPSRRTWTRQPPESVEIDWRHPLAQGLIFAVIPGIYRNLVDNAPLRRYSNMFGDFQVGGQAQGRVFQAGSVAYPSPASADSVWARLDVQEGSFLVVVGHEHDMGGISSLMHRYKGGADDFGVSWEMGITGWYGTRSWWSPYPRFSVGNVSVSPFSHALKELGMTPAVLALSCGTTRRSFFANGTREWEGPGGALAYTYSEENEAGVVFGDSGQCEPSKPSLGLIWSRALSDAELQAISANPWQIFLPRRRIAYLNPKVATHDPDPIPETPADPPADPPVRLEMRSALMKKLEMMSPIGHISSILKRKNRVFVNDVGTDIVLDCGVDIGAALVTTIRARNPAGRVVEWPATPVGSRRISYSLKEGDINMTGKWRLQAYVEMPNWRGRGAWVELEALA